jgi:hypothetical protein
LRYATTFLLAALLALAPVGAEETITIDDLNLGTHWYGPKVTTKDLAGKVVLVELWGS